MAKEPPIKILILVVNTNKTDHARELLNNVGACATWSFLGRGIGRGGIMDILGLDSPEKTVFISIVPSKESTKILAALCKDLDLYKEKIGMALTIPLGAISRDTLNAFLEVKKQNEQELKQIEEEQKQQEQLQEQKDKKENAL